VTTVDHRIRQEISSCRSCGHDALTTVVDLGVHPEANTFPETAEAARHAPRWPLRVFVCTNCWLLQLDDSGPAEAALPGPAGYELSQTMRAHVEEFVDDVLARRPTQSDTSRAVELASHASYLYPFLAGRGVPSIIVEGSPPLAAAALQAGRPVLARPFGLAAAEELVASGGPTDLVIDNYLLAHVSDPSDFAAGLRVLLRPGGLAVLELDHVLPLLVDRRFDALRHGHFSYFGLISVGALLERHGLMVFDVEPQPVYGGALRVFVAHAGDTTHPVSDTVGRAMDAERVAALPRVATYLRFADDVATLRNEIVGFLAERRRQGDDVVAYGAPSRGNTLLNYCVVTTELVAYTVDRSPSKQGRFLPGSGIPIEDPARIFETRPRYVLILTWDIKDEVISQLAGIRAWGGRFVVPIPRLRVLPAP